MAVRLPMPRLEPVTIATLPDRFASFCRSMKSSLGTGQRLPTAQNADRTWSAASPTAWPPL
jgi:hypothetical protein